MSAALDLSAYSREDIQRAPLVWRSNGAGMRVRVRDLEWIKSNLRPKPIVDATPKASLPPPPLSEMDDTNWINRQAIERYHEDEPPAQFGSEVMRQVLEAYPFFTVAMVKGPFRNRYLVACRWHVAYEIHRRTALSLPGTGRVMGGKDHTTLIHAIRGWPAKAAKLGIPCKPLGGE